MSRFPSPHSLDEQAKRLAAQDREENGDGLPSADSNDSNGIAEESSWRYLVSVLLDEIDINSHPWDIQVTLSSDMTMHPGDLCADSAARLLGIEEMGMPWFRGLARD
ncbi:unnamed protein product [Symbiodinium sp. CCMP2592]|nr:unnamed protein product [Symbiodinium sp. CCMP2592]